VEHLNRAEEEGNDLRAPGHLDQPDTQEEIEICTVCEKSCFVNHRDGDKKKIFRLQPRLKFFRTDFSFYWPAFSQIRKHFVSGRSMAINLEQSQVYNVGFIPETNLNFPIITF
jgi:hypothetical protein